MRKLIYQGFIFTNSEGHTDSWKLTIKDQHRLVLYSNYAV